MNKEENKQQKRSYPFKKILLFGEIVIFGFVALFVNFWIMLQTCSNCAILTGLICLLGWLPGLLVGFIIFLLILRTKYEKSIKLKNTTIVSFIIAIIIIIPAVFFYYNTVPSNKITNQWYCDKDQDIFEVLKSMEINYGSTYPLKSGDLEFVNSSMQRDYFDWEYDASTRVITMTGYRYQDWKLKLRLDIIFLGSNYTMTTHYISDDNFNLFDPLLFDNTTWKGSLYFEDQGRNDTLGSEIIAVSIVVFLFIAGYIISRKNNKK